MPEMQKSCQRKIPDFEEKSRLKWKTEKVWDIFVKSHKQKCRIVVGDVGKSLGPPRSFAEIRQRVVAAEISLRSGALTKRF